MESLRSKVVLVTGASGFIGSHLTRRLLEEGAEVHVLLRKDTNLFRIQDIVNKLKVWYGDLSDYSAICPCIRNSRPQIVFHLAALRNVKREPELIEAMIDINIKGTLNLLRAAIKEKMTLECFVNTGSSEEYGNGPVPFDEDQREMPVSPYSASKVAATYFCQMIHKSMGLPIITLRPFLIYGPNQDTDMFIPSLIRHCIEARDFPMTDGNQTRDFNYIDDVVEAYLLAAGRPEAAGEVINIGNGIEYRVRDVAEKIVDIMGNPIKLLIGALSKRPGEAVHFFCNNEKARKLLEWTPKISLNDGLERTISWYECFFPKSKNVVRIPDV